MAEIGSQWYNPFDPQDPDAVASAALGTNPQEYAAQVAVRPQSRIAQRRTQSLAQANTPNQQVAGEFGALDVAHRDEPGYPGAFLPTGSVFDPHEMKALGVPVASGGYLVRDTRPNTVEDFLNPISQEAGIMNVPGAALRDRLAVETAQYNEMQAKIDDINRLLDERHRLIDEMIRKRKEGQVK